MENTNITDNTRQAGHSADSTINAVTDISHQQRIQVSILLMILIQDNSHLRRKALSDYQICMRKMSTILSLNLL